MWQKVRVDKGRNGTSGLRKVIWEQNLSDGNKKGLVSGGWTGGWRKQGPRAVYSTHTFGEHCFPKGIRMSISKPVDSTWACLWYSLVDWSSNYVLFSCLPKAKSSRTGYHVPDVPEPRGGGRELGWRRAFFLRSIKGAVLWHSQEAWQLLLFWAGLWQPRKTNVEQGGIKAWNRILLTGGGMPNNAISAGLGVINKCLRHL